MKSSEIREQAIIAFKAGDLAKIEELASIAVKTAASHRKEADALDDVAARCDTARIKLSELAEKVFDGVEVQKVVEVAAAPKPEPVAPEPEPEPEVIPEPEPEVAPEPVVSTPEAASEEIEVDDEFVATVEETPAPEPTVVAEEAVVEAADEEDLGDLAELENLLSNIPTEEAPAEQPAVEAQQEEIISDEDLTVDLDEDDLAELDDLVGEIGIHEAAPTTPATEEINIDDELAGLDDLD